MTLRGEIHHTVRPVPLEQAAQRRPVANIYPRQIDSVEGDCGIEFRSDA